MFRHILIATDGSPVSEEAVRHGLALAGTLKSRATVLTVMPPFHVAAIEPAIVTARREQYDQDLPSVAARRLAFPQEEARRSGVACETVHVIAEHPWAAIIETAAARGCDLIVMGSHGRKGISALVIGSETTKVLTHTKLPTLVCR